MVETDEERRLRMAHATDRLTLLDTLVEASEDEVDEIVAELETAECPACAMAAARCFDSYELSFRPLAFCCVFCPGLLAHVA